MLRVRTLGVGSRGIDWTRVDQLIALVLLLEIELQVWLGPAGGGRLLPALGGVVVCLAVAFRRRWPLAGMLAIVAALTVKTVLGSAPGRLNDTVGLLPALLLLFYGMGAFAPPRRSLWVLGLAVVVSSANLVTTPGTPAAAVPFAAIFVALLPYTLGRMMRARAARERAERERAERIDADRDWTARTAAWQERSRIARELHDVIAHSVSVMVIQAGGARLVMSSDPERAEASLRAVERAGQEALAEMRMLLGVLDDDRDPRALAPQPGLADIQDLLFHARSSGLETELHVDGEPAAVPPALDLCAHRIVQEALTNAIKHAAPARARVCVRWRQDTLELEISDDGRGPGAISGASGGHGIAGMRERAALHGGNIQAGAGPDGGFTVRAHLPLTQEPV